LDFRRGNLVAYDQACKDTQRKLASIDKLRAAVNIKQDKVDVAIEELAECKKEETVTRELFKASSDAVKDELKRMETDRILQMQSLLARFAHSQLSVSRDLLSLWTGLVNSPLSQPSL
jgi:hypothetical protein